MNASSNTLILVRILVRAGWAGTAGLRSPATGAASMSRPEVPKMSAASTDTLIWASSDGFSTRCFSAVRAPIRPRIVHGYPRQR
jgi:hypothetical protein